MYIVHIWTGKLCNLYIEVSSILDSLTYKVQNIVMSHLGQVVNLLFSKPGLFILHKKLSYGFGKKASFRF